MSSRRIRHQVPIDLIARFVRGASWAIGDQAFISATNFLGMVVAARVLTTEDFGLYALAYAGLWAANTVQSSLITQPFGVLAARRNLDEYRRYASATGLMQAVLMLAIGVPIIVVGALVDDPAASGILVIIGFTVITWQSQEFVRRVLYVEGRMPAVIAIDVISYGGQFALIAGLALSGRLTVGSALAAAGISSAVSALVGLVLVRHTLFHRPLRAAVPEMLSQGRWLLGADLGAFICLSSAPFVLAASGGPHLVAVYTAAQLLLNPLNIIWFASATVVPIRLSRTRAHHGEQAARAELRTFYRLTMPVIAGFCAFMVVFGEPILDFVYGVEYVGYGWVIAVGALFRAFAFHGFLLSLGLRSLEMARPIFVGLAAAVPFSLVVGTALTFALGILGAMLGMFGAAAIWTAIWARAYFGGAGRNDDRAGDDLSVTIDRDRSIRA